MTVKYDPDADAASVSLREDQFAATEEVDP
jgi:uncharacterized protein YuzE